jgi:hypothetical protein
MKFDKMRLKVFYILFLFIGINVSCLFPIHYSHIDLLFDHIYVPAHLQNQLNFGESINDLLSCIYLC